METARLKSAGLELAAFRHIAPGKCAARCPQLRGTFAPLVHRAGRVHSRRHAAIRSAESHAPELFRDSKDLPGIDVGKLGAAGSGLTVNSRKPRAPLEVPLPVITPNRSVAAPDTEPASAPEASVRSEEESQVYRSDVWAWRKQKLMQIAAFVIPALAIPLSDPLMSMLDTVCVGRFGSTMQLAGLGPAALVFYSVTNLFLCQGMAVTALVSRALEAGDTPQAQRALSAGLGLAVVAGVSVTAGLEIFGAQVLAATGAAPDLIAPGLEYLKIRALGLTAVFISNIGQGAILAQKDTATPAVTIGCACAVNAVLDLLLIGHMGCGIAGAAWATLAAQLIECGITAWALFNRGIVRPAFAAMKSEEIQSFKNISGPLSFVYLCRQLCLILIQLRATALCVLSVAAHQPLWSLWGFCSKTTAPLEQAALVFLPSCKSGSQKREMISLLLVCGAALGIVSGLISSLVPYLAPSLFTPDARLFPFMKSVLAPCLISQILLGINVAHNGILIAEDDTSFLGGQLFRTLLVCAGFCQLTAVMGWGLQGVWWAMVVFFVAQCSQSTYRVATHHLGLFSCQDKGRAAVALC